MCALLPIRAIHHTLPLSVMTGLVPNLGLCHPDPNQAHSLAQTGLPGVGEAVPQALAMTPEQPVEDAVKQPVQVEALYIRLPPDPLQR